MRPPAELRRMRRGVVVTPLFQFQTEQSPQQKGDAEPDGRSQDEERDRNMLHAAFSSAPIQRGQTQARHKKVITIS